MHPTRRAFFIVLLAMLFPCGALAAGSGHGQAARVGLLLNSIPGVTEEESLVQGAGMAVREINEAGGVNGCPVVLSVHDTKGTPIGAKAAAEEAIAAGAVALIGPSRSSQAIEAAKVAKREGVVLIAHVATNPALAAMGETIFQICFDDALQARTMALYARENLGAMTAVVLVDVSSAYAQEMGRYFRERFEELGGGVAAEIEYKQKERDFRELAAKAARHDPDVLFLPGYWLDSAMILKETMSIGSRAAPLGGDGWASLNFRKHLGAYDKDLFYTDHFAPTADNPKALDFAARFEIAHGEPATAGAALAYDAVSLLAEAATRSGAFDPEGLRRGLAGIGGFKGLTGTISFDSQGKTKKNVHVMRLSEGRVTLLKTFDPEEAARK